MEWFFLIVFVVIVGIPLGILGYLVYNISKGLREGWGRDE